MSYNSTHTGAQIDAAIDAVETKQDRLVSGTNIRTINGQSIMGSGNLSIEATGVYECTYSVTTYADVVAAIQAGKTPIVKIGDPYEDVFTLSEWDKQNEILCFNSAYMEMYGDDYLISVGCVLLQNTSDDTNGWTTSLYQAIPRSGTYYTTEEVDSRLSAKQDTLTSGTNIKTINGESVLGSGNIEIQGGGGQLSAWELIGTTTNTTAITIDTSGYNELLLVHKGQVSANATKYDSTTIVIDDIGTNPLDITMGGISTSAGGYGCNAKVSKTSLAPQWVYNGGTAVTAYVQTWKIYGRTNFSVANFIVSDGVPSASMGSNGDLFLKV